MFIVQLRIYQFLQSMRKKTNSISDTLKIHKKEKPQRYPSFTVLWAQVCIALAEHSQVSSSQ